MFSSELMKMALLKFSCAISNAVNRWPWLIIDRVEIIIMIIIRRSISMTQAPFRSLQKILPRSGIMNNN